MDTLLIIFTGNPGIVDVYDYFLKSLHDKLPKNFGVVSSKLQTRDSVLINN